MQDNEIRSDLNGDHSTSGERTPLTSNSHGNPSYIEERAKFSSGVERAAALSHHHNHHNNGNGEQMMYVLANKKKPCKDRTNCTLAFLASVTALLLCVFALTLDIWGGSLHHLSQSGDQVLFDELGRYIFEDYDAHTPFSDFLPGLAGIYGKPIYAFFVNRGQGIASFGFESKNYPIMEFNPANIAYQNTPTLGFRTFLQGQRGRKSFLIEPFSPLNTNHLKLEDRNSNSLPKRIMYSGENEMQIREIDYQHYLETNVSYFILPEEDFGAFVRRTSITNTHAKESVSFSMLDGLARMQPAGGKLEELLKSMGRTLEGWMGVHFLYPDSISMPFYRLTAEPKDTASVKFQKRGHYCLAMMEGRGQETTRLLPIVYDTSKVFGEDTTLLQPIELYSTSIQNIVRGPQYGMAKTSSCFAAVDDVTLRPGETVTISTFYGRTDHILDVPVQASRIMEKGFVPYKLTRTREVMRQITASITTRTKNKLFDEHVRQMYLDNSLRGGIPIILGGQDDNDGVLNADEDPKLKVFHVFSRIHGDLERDYNDFVLSPTFFSEGPGNFRDVVQNRRDDVIFNPRIGSFNLKTFLSFIQADGYEPLSVEGAVFTIKDEATCNWIAENAVGPADGHRAQREALSGILNRGPFRPGQLFELMSEQNIELLISRQQFMDMVASRAESTPMAVYETGFWADHWTYYLDMIESYLSIFPDTEERFLFDTNLPYFFSPASVQPRSKKYVLTLAFDGTHKHVQQLYATVKDKTKRGYMDQFFSNYTGWYELVAHWQHDQNKNVFKSPAISKLFLLAALKFSTRDAYGVGIEYEGGRPGWDDANNGLAGMLGSGMPETFALKSLLDYLLLAVRKYRRPITIPVELSELVYSIGASLERLDAFVDEFPCTTQVPSELFQYWDEVSAARENYRGKTKITFSGQVWTMNYNNLVETLQRWIAEVNRGIARAASLGTVGVGDDGTSGIMPTYFAYNVTSWELSGDQNKDGHPLVHPKGMIVRRFPLFLEGPTRMMKTVDSGSARAIYQRVRASDLHDVALSMYTLSANLTGQPISIGRTMAFPSGWLENQSIWLHMSYKFYLELLRQGLFDDFFSEISSGGLLPFMDPGTYGRSIITCSSFIASSAFADPSMRGRGFLPRLSGSTAEFLSMWVLMFIGSKPFFVDGSTRELRMQLIPSLPAWFFDTQGEDGLETIPRVSFKLFSSIQVHYYNERKIDLFGVVAIRYRIWLRDGLNFEIAGASIPSDLADKIRRVVFVEMIEVYF